MWVDDARGVAAARGIVTLLTHCERRFSGNAPMLGAYRQFLEFIAASPQFEWTLAGHLAQAAA